VPDVVVLAKAIGDGVSLGAIIAKPQLADLMKPGTHASTFGGNPLACAAGVAVVEAIEEENLLQAATQRGAYLRQKLEQLQEKYPIITEIRQVGLMIGVELSVAGDDIVAAALERGLRVNCTQQTVLRMSPGMTVTDEMIDQAVAILDESFAQCQNGLLQTPAEG